MLAIVTFVPQEAAGFLRQLRQRRRIPTRCGRASRGTYHGLDTVVMVAGMGSANALSGIRALMDAAPVSAIAVCGVAAGLDPDLRVGAVVLAEALRDESGLHVPAHHSVAPHFSSLKQLVQGTVLTVGSILATGEQKRSHSPSAAVADMETVAAAAAAEEAGLPWCALRAVSDTVHEDLPLDFNRLLARDGNLPLRNILAAVVRNPRCVPGLLRLGRNTSVAAAALCEAAAWFIPSWYRSLPQPLVDAEP